MDKTTKDQATTILEKIGLDPSTAIRMFFKQIIVQDGLPFAAKTTTISDHELTEIKQILLQSRQDVLNGDIYDLKSIKSDYTDRLSGSNND
ncbi:hypothetical protein IV55_GL001686 [Furfurilactobacillus siliginis]|nr:hypothetical protein IV55_GL001686 [Furfurilactobacillus siliginis]